MTQSFDMRVHEPKTLFMSLVIVEIDPNSLLEQVFKSDKKTVSKGRAVSDRNQALLDFCNLLEELRRFTVTLKYTFTS